jgi:EmrB/QacA subfamily drug resistance transporter
VQGKRIHYRTTLAVLALSALSFSLLQSLVLPALPSFEHALHTSATGASWILSAYLLSAAIATPTLGRVGDMIGKEKMLVMVLIGLGVGTLISALASSIAVVIVGRIVQGAGGAIFPLAFGIIRDEFPPDKVAAGIGIISSILGIGSGAGIVLAGPIITHLSYHWLFWIPLVMIVVATIATFAYIPESPVRAPGGINWLGAVLLAGWLTTGLVALSEATTWGWTSGPVVILFAVTVMLIGLWIWAEMRSDHPVVDMTMMRVRAVWTTNLAALLFGFGMFSMFIAAPQFVQTPVGVGYGFGASVTKAGLFLAPLSLAMLLVAPLIGRLTAAVGAKSLLVAGSGFGAASYFLLAAEHSHQWSFYVSSALLGVGVALGFASMANLIIQAVPASQTSVATGMNNNIRSIGGALGSSIATSIIVTDLLPSGFPKETGFVVAFLVCGASMVVAALAALAVPGRSRPEAHPLPFTPPGEAEVISGPAYLSGTLE